MNRLVDQQVRYNTESRDSWQCFAEHRRRVTRLIADSAPSAGGLSLCVLGAGNCNDLALKQLAGRFDEIHLFDIDSAALQAGVAAQEMAQHPAIRLWGDRDLTGICDQVCHWSPDNPPADRAVDEVIEAARVANPLAIETSYDVVASVCVLSQMIDSIVLTLGEQHPQFLDLVRVVRQRHLQLMAESTNVGGSVILVTDIASSETAPEIVSATSEELPPLLANMINRRNFFHGMNPAVLADLLRNDPVISPLVGSVEFAPPWVWDFGVRHYAVVGLRFQRV